MKLLILGLKDVTETPLALVSFPGTVNESNRHIKGGNLHTPIQALSAFNMHAYSRPKNWRRSYLLEELNLWLLSPY